MSLLAETYHLSSTLLLGAVLGATAAYLLGWRRLRSAGEPAATRMRLGLWLAGAVLLAVAVAGPLDRLAETRLMSAHMAQHLLLISAVPALLLPAVLPLRAAAKRLDPRPTRPGTAALCLVAAVGAIWFLHVPVVLESGLRVLVLGDVQHVLLLAAGCALTWPLLGPQRLGGMPAVAFLVAAEVGIGALGIVLAWSPDVLYPFYEDVPRLLGLSVLDDQAAAGALLLVVEEPFLAIEFAAAFIGGVLSQTGDE